MKWDSSQWEVQGGLLRIRRDVYRLSMLAGMNSYPNGDVWLVLLGGVEAEVTGVMSAEEATAILAGAESQASRP